MPFRLGAVPEVQRAVAVERSDDSTLRTRHAGSAPLQCYGRNPGVGWEEGRRENPAFRGELRGFSGGSDRRRSGDLSIFSRTLYQLSYRALQPSCG